MGRGLLQLRHDVQELFVCDACRRREATDGKDAFRQCPGLVEDDGIDLRYGIQYVSALEKNTAPRGSSDSRKVAERDADD